MMWWAKKAKKPTTKSRAQEPYASGVAEAFKALSCPPAASVKCGDEYLHELLDGYDEYAEWAEQDDKSKRPELSSRIQALGRRCKEAESIARTKVPRLMKDLHDAGRRIEELEMRERLNTYEVRAIHETLKSARAPQEGTILERLQGLLRARETRWYWRIATNARLAEDVVPFPMRTLQDAKVELQRIREHWEAAGVTAQAWLERSDDAGATWKRCNEKGEVIP